MSDILRLSTPGVPKVPKKKKKRCFASNTPIHLKDRVVQICDIKIGDTLHDGSKVTAIMKLLSEKFPVYSLDGIIVTGNHEVYHKVHGWLPVEQHPNSIEHQNFTDPYLYCFNTNNKVIKIGKYTFSDWDDLDDIDLRNLYKNGKVYDGFSKQSIHEKFDSGFSQNTSVLMCDGSYKNISEVNVGDRLWNSNDVYGIVKVQGRTLSNYTYQNKVVRCSDNVSILGSRFSSINTSNIKGIDSKKSELMYHLLTNTGTFFTTGLRVGDYNCGIEQYLNL
jgi:hypothetical protein